MKNSHSVDFSKYIEKILLGHAENDLDTLRTQIHSIKSIANLVGALNLAHYCQEAEKLLIASSSLMECEGAIILVVHEASRIQREMDFTPSHRTI